MQRFALTFLLVPALASAMAQNNVPRAVPTNPPAAVNAAESKASAPAPSSVTGVPRYRAGFRGPRETTAPATPGAMSRVGEDGAIDPGEATLAIAQFRNNDLGIAAGTPIRVRLQAAFDSGHVHNGQVLQGTLDKALGSLPAGTPVELSVVSAAAAGQMNSQGELSVQVIRIAGKQALSQVITAEGKEGEKLTQDGAPARGTEAQIGPDQPLVLPAA